MSEDKDGCLARVKWESYVDGDYSWVSAVICSSGLIFKRVFISAHLCVCVCGCVCVAAEEKKVHDLSSSSAGM